MGNVVLSLPLPTERQESFLSDRHRYIAFGGARGGGKSFAVRLKACLMCLNFPGIRIMIVRRTYPEVAVFDVEGFRVLMTHIGGYPDHYDRRALAHIYQTRPTIFVAGHSHILKVIYDKRFSLLHLNPGAAGRYGFHKVRTALRFTLDGGDIRDMEIGEWPR